MLRPLVASLPFVVLAASARASELDDLLARGEVSLIESTADGGLQQVTTFSRIHAPVAGVWAKLIDFASYETWMPQVATSDEVERTEASVTVDWSIKVPGPNVNFRARYDLEPVAYKVTATGVSGSVAGGVWEWVLKDEGATTFVTRTTYASAVVDTWIVRQFDDEAHSLELGINAASPIIEVRGLKAAVEGK